LLDSAQITSVKDATGSVLLGTTVCFVVDCGVEEEPVVTVPDDDDFELYRCLSVEFSARWVHQQLDQ